MQVSIYCNDNSSYIVETNRLCGEIEGSRLVHAQLRRVLGNMVEYSKPQFDSYAASLPPTSPEVLSDAEVCEMLQPVLTMGRDSKLDAKLLTTKILCDLSTSETLQQILCDSGCLAVLIELATSESSLEVRQHALVALAQLSTPIAYHETLIDVGIVPVLLNLEVDGSFESAEMRREIVRILANLAARFGAKVVDAAGHPAIISWMETVAQITDDTRLKLHAARASEIFSGVIESNNNSEEAPGV